MNFYNIKNNFNYYNIYRGLLLILIFVIVIITTFTISYALASASYEKDTNITNDTISNDDYNDNYYDIETLPQHTQTITQHEVLRIQ